MWMSDVFDLLMLENWKFCKEKHLPRVSGVDRKSAPRVHCLASLGGAS